MSIQINDLNKFKLLIQNFEDRFEKNAKIFIEYCLYQSMLINNENSIDEELDRFLKMSNEKRKEGYFSWLDFTAQMEKRKIER